MIDDVGAEPAGQLDRGLGAGGRGGGRVERGRRRCGGWVRSAPAPRSPRRWRRPPRWPRRHRPRPPALRRRGARRRHGGHRACSSTLRASSRKRSASSGPVGRLPYQARSNSSAASPNSGAASGAACADLAPVLARSCATPPGRPPAGATARRRAPGSGPAARHANGPRPRASRPRPASRGAARAGGGAASARRASSTFTRFDRRIDRTASTTTVTAAATASTRMIHPMTELPPPPEPLSVPKMREMNSSIFSSTFCHHGWAGSWYSGALEDLLGDGAGLVGVSRHGRRRRSPAAGGRGPRCGPAGRGRAARC